MQSRISTLDHNSIAEPLRKRIEERFATFSIAATHPAHMAFIGTALEQGGERILLDYGGMAVHELLSRWKHILEFGRDDQIADPERGRESLRDCSEVDGLAGVLQPMQRQHGIDVVAIFAVVVVLNNVGVCLPRPVE